MRHLKAQWLLSGLTCAYVVLTCLTGRAFLCKALPGQQAPQVQEFDFALCDKIPVNLAAGPPDHPRLVEIKWIRIEPKELAGGITARVGWSAAAEATWRIAVDLLDDRGRLLRDSRANEVVFTGKAGGSENAVHHYADLDLGFKSFRTRRYATKVRLSLERVSDRLINAPTAESAGHPLQIKVIGGQSHKPLADVAVVATMYYTDKRLGKEVFLYSTDAQGLCRITGLKPASVHFVIQKDGYGTMWCSGSTQPSAQPVPESMVVEMRPAQPIGGTIQDHEGKPIPDVQVKVNVNSSEVGGMVWTNQIVRTDKDGFWRANGVPNEPDTVSLELKHLEYVTSYAWDTTIISRQLATAQAFQHIEHMTKGISVDGRVLDVNGQPVSRAAVTLAPPRRGGFQYGYACILTDAAGRFHFGCAKDMRGDTNTGGGPTAVYVEAPGYAPMMKRLLIEPNMPPLEFRLSTGRTATVRVVNSDGQPVLGASARLYPLPEDPGRSVFLEMSTDEQGRFRATNVPTSEMRMTIEKKGYLTIKDHILPISEEEYTLTMTPGGRLWGTVCDAQTDEPIPHFEVYISHATDTCLVMFSDRAKFHDGRYEYVFEKAASVDLRLTIFAPGYREATSEPFRQEEGTRQMDFKLVKKPVGETIPRPLGSARVVRGGVQDPNGQPAAGVMLVTCPEISTRATTDEQGRFKLSCAPGSGWPPGVRIPTVYVIARDCAHNLVAAVKLEDTVTGDLLIRLIPGVILSGRVIDPEGKGIPGVRLFPLLCLGFGATLRLADTAQSDAKGYFEIRALPPGRRYYIQAMADGYASWPVEVNRTKPVKRSLELEPLVLLPTNLTVTGLVVTAEGKPVGGANVYGSGPSQPRCATRTDNQGRFTLEKVCAGPITIRARVGGADGLRGGTETEGGASEVRIVVTGTGPQGAPAER